MYEFTDINEVPAAALPSVAMSFNGVYFEDEIAGYCTLNVGGRELIENELTVAKGVGRDGSVIVSERLPSRILIIQFILKAANAAECRFNFEKLNQLLRANGRTNSLIQFNDEPDRSYYGRLQAVADVPFDRNTITGTFNFLCEDPYKYGDTYAVSGLSVTIGNFCPYRIIPDSITATLSANATKITIDNTTTGKHIILNGSYTAGQALIVNIKNRTVTLNGQNIMNNLDYVESDFYTFEIAAGDIVTMTPASVLSLTARGRWL